MASCEIKNDLAEIREMNSPYSSLPSSPISPKHSSSLSSIESLSISTSTSNNTVVLTSVADRLDCNKMSRELAGESSSDPVDVPFKISSAVKQRFKSEFGKAVHSFDSTISRINSSTPTPTLVSVGSAEKTIPILEEHEFREKNKIAVKANVAVKEFCRSPPMSRKVDEKSYKSIKNVLLVLHRDLLYCIVFRARVSK